MPASQESISSSPRCSISNTAPCYYPGKAAEDGANVWVPATYIEDMDEVTSPLFQPEPVSGIAAFGKGTNG